ncbi:type II toxin-antitoxin system HicA family toxin [Sphingomonas glacialis]|uniref:Type II toxin-antitoxin system HicA family toxin n=1 Tax=Sphingomonas glacialis TaxID=658225 RepID=A0A502FKV1_9SPHN|nr:type II toxin-antitoxin system HicA family toxin [Sphingomonas glacialis]TPG49806.1 type II toxin-antitoxin system HicA family toxin [Sphingomonas glacialis]
MTKIAILFVSVSDNPGASLSFRDFERLLLAFGFLPVRQKGSHRSYKHPIAQRMLVVQPQGKDAKGYQIRQFLDMIEQYGLTIDDR